MVASGESVAPQGFRGHAATNAIEGPEIRLVEYVRFAKNLPDLKDVVWDSVRWTLDALKHSSHFERFHHRTNISVIFAQPKARTVSSRAGEKAGFVEPFASFAKAFVARRFIAQGMTHVFNEISALRHLEKTLRKAGKNSVAALTLRDFHLAEESIIAHHKGESRYSIPCALALVAKEIDLHRLSQVRIGYTNRVKPQPRGDGRSLEDQKNGEDKMVSGDVLERLAELSANPPEDLNDHLVIRIVDLLFALGFRIGEVLTLPYDCWVVSAAEVVINPATGEKGHPEGIRYVAEKLRRYEIKWIPTYAVEMVRRAIDDIKRIGMPAREISRWMEENPGRLKPFADLQPNSLIGGVDACKRLGLDAQALNIWRKYLERRKPVGALGPSHLGGDCYLVSDIEIFYLRLRGSTITIKFSGGKSQRLSDTLIATFRAKGGDAGKVRRYYTWLPVPMKYPSFSRILSKGKRRSRPSLLPPELKASSHQFRHWLNTKADEGGLSDIDLMKWMGRKTIAQNYEYKHGTVARRIEMTKELIRGGMTHGKIARIAAGLFGDDLESFLNGQIEAVHVMPTGLCAHNFASAPCQEHHQCLRGCGDYLRVKNDDEQRTALLELQRKQLTVLEYHQRLLFEGYVWADKWITSAKEHLRGIEAALAIDDQPSLKGSAGALVSVFPGAPSKQKALE